MSLTVVSDPDVPGVLRVARSAELPRPHVGVLGAVHGNERCGLAALERLTDAVSSGALAPSAGTWVLVHGNPEASEAGRRYTQGGADLNRLFDFAFETNLPRAQWTPEHERAALLRPVLEGLDALLDLHSATWPTPPFAIVNDAPASRELARRLGVGFVTQGWGGPGLLMDRVSIGLLGKQGLPAVSVECGQHDEPDAIEEAWRCTVRFLRASGVLDGEAPRGDARFLEIVEIVSRPSETFRFVRPFRGLDVLEAGELLAADRIAELRVRERCYVLMPNDTVPVGRDMVFLARELAAPE